ncbi:MAG: hypothetical protein HY699_02405 [Deltaproteobacteria bacterium]|nr:hypothetical protein [Deltaproteobacteria bacterium]
MSFPASVRRSREMGEKPAGAGAAIPPLRPRARRPPISRLPLRLRLNRHLERHAQRYYRTGDYLLYAGVVAVLLSATYLLAFSD